MLAYKVLHKREAFVFLYDTIVDDNYYLNCQINSQSAFLIIALDPFYYIN